MALEVRLQVPPPSASILCPLHTGHLLQEMTGEGCSIALCGCVMMSLLGKEMILVCDEDVATVENRADRQLPLPFTGRNWRGVAHPLRSHSYCKAS